MRGVIRHRVYSKRFPSLSTHVLSSSGLQQHTASRPLFYPYPLPASKLCEFTLSIMTLAHEIHGLNFPSPPVFVSAARGKFLGNSFRALKADALNVAQTFLLKQLVDDFCKIYPKANCSLPVCTLRSSDRDPPSLNVDSLIICRR